ncbi:DUF1189 family protein [Ruoffia tabacinasalis]|uniref:Maltodextrose utilization protein MalA n=1 Tax=Ruoffia tabacinasalis TaxID=87458 RepID=A0ABS0LJZ0_9LACT|nr:DUF1189 family protein [Ruoffia tabacinasalis]MBG9978605.1 hypothetical protein [Ruoffia tabacinasalis]
MAQVFPINYFITAFSAVKSFTQRQYLKHWQKLVVMILLASLMMIPLSFQLGRTTGADLTNYVPEVMDYIDESVVQELNTLDNSGTDLMITEEKIIKENDELIIGLAPSTEAAETLLSDRGGIIYTSDQTIFGEDSSSLFYQPYTGDKAMNEVEDVGSLKTLMSQQWFWSNRTSIVLTNYIQLSALIIVSLLLLVLGSSFFLSFMRKNDMYDINSYSEALTIVLNCLGLPTLIAMVIGLISGNPTTMLTVQGLLFVLMLMWVYWKTHFNDTYVQNK